MRHLSPTEILKAHAIERRLRAAIKTVSLDKDPNRAVPQMSDGQFVDSCQLVTGVPEWTLMMLEVYYCEDAGSQWTEVLVEIQGQPQEVRVEQVPIRLTLREAAERVGMGIDHFEARRIHRQAIDRVTENLIARAGRKGAAA